MVGILHSVWCATVDAGWTFTHHFLLLELRLDLVLGVAVDRFVQLRKQTTDTDINQRIVVDAIQNLAGLSEEIFTEVSVCEL